LNKKRSASLKNNIRLFLYLPILLILLLLAGCASKGKVAPVSEPSWFAVLKEGEETNRFLIKISSMGTSRDQVLQSAVDQIYEKIISLPGSGFKDSGDRDRTQLKEEIRKIIEKKDSWLTAFLNTIRQEWTVSEGRHFYFGAFYLDKNSKDAMLDKLVKNLYGNDHALHVHLENALRFESEGNYYQGAEELIKAAQNAKSFSGFMADEISQQLINRALGLLEKIDVKTLGIPEGIKSNLRIDKPFQLLCNADGKALDHVEFLVSYQGKKRDGTKGDFVRRLVSNQSGILEFYHPFIPFTGDSLVQFSPGSRDFHAEILNLEKEKLDVTGLKNWVKSRTNSFNLKVTSGARSVPMGIVLLHTDITGSSLKQDDSTVSLADALAQNGFNVSILPLDPKEITAMSEAEFLRDLRALYKGKFTRVVYGVVGIQDFEARNDSFRVNTAGFLKVVDVESSEILLDLNIDKSVESRSNTLAVSTSFRELGKAFAEEIIKTLE